MIFLSPSLLLLLAAPAQLGSVLFLSLLLSLRGLNIASTSTACRVVPL